MQIAGKEIDIEKVKAYALKKTRSELDRRYHLSDCPKDDVDCCLLHYAWEDMMRLLQVGRASTNICAEKVMAEIIRSGVSRDNINYKNDTFRFKLTNHRYRIERREAGFGAHPTGLQVSDIYERITAEDFVNFIYKFDSLIPEIIDAGATLAQEIIQIQIEEKKEETAQQLAYTTVRSILEEFLKPLGICYNYSVEDGVAHVKMRQVMEADFSITIHELADKVKDTEALLASMHVVDASNEIIQDGLPLFRRGLGIEFTI